MTAHPAEPPGTGQAGPAAGSDPDLVAARLLLSGPADPVEPALLDGVDRADLAAALRRAVADLDPAEQRVRLAAAFEAMVGLRAVGQELGGDAVPHGGG